MEYKLTPFFLFKILFLEFVDFRYLSGASESTRNDGWLRHAVITPKCEELLIIIMIKRCNVIYEEMDYMLAFCRLILSNRRVFSKYFTYII